MLVSWSPDSVMTVAMLLTPLLCLASLELTKAQHFFGPPAIGFGAGLISLHRSLPLATSIGGWCCYVDEQMTNTLDW